MSKTYTVRSGQNLYDVALTLYGSIEGIFDLLISNDDISLNSQLSHGQVLNYNEEFMIEQSLPDWFNSHDVIVKNGCHYLENIDMKSVIADFVDTQNAAVAKLFKTGQMSVNYDITDESAAKKNTFWEDFDGNAIMLPTADTQAVAEKGILVSDDGKWSNIGISDDILSMGDLKDRVKAAIGVELDMDALSKSALTVNLISMFTAGMILKPIVSYDEETFFSMLATPKIIVHQSGMDAAFGLQIEANRLVAVDWGDGSDLEYCWYAQARQDMSHKYNDYEKHVIKIYGNAEFVNLDFTNLNGVYTPMENIYIEKKFVTPYPEAESVNRLLIIK